MWHAWGKGENRYKVLLRRYDGKLGIDGKMRILRVLKNLDLGSAVLANFSQNRKEWFVIVKVAIKTSGSIKRREFLD